MPRGHFHWGPPLPPHEGPHHPWGHWGDSAEVQALAERLQRYVSPSDARWAADMLAHDPGPGRLHGLLLLAVLERLEALLARPAGEGPAGSAPRASEP